MDEDDEMTNLLKNSRVMCWRGEGQDDHWCDEDMFMVLKNEGHEIVVHLSVCKSYPGTEVSAWIERHRVKVASTALNGFHINIKENDPQTMLMFKLRWL